MKRMVRTRSDQLVERIEEEASMNQCSFNGTFGHRSSYIVAGQITVIAYCTSGMPW